MYTGLVNNDNGTTTAPNCSTTDTSASGPGTYPSTCSGAVDANYTILYAPGTVTDVRAPQTTVPSASPFLASSMMGA
jgi:hypothetical protein